MDMIAQGKLISEWYKDFNGRYSINELQKIVLEGGDLGKLVLREKGLLTLD